MLLEKSVRSVLPKNHRHPGFTLMELLVVIAIIAVLALLVSALSRKMLDKAKKVTSVNNMRRVAVATIAYTSENNGKLNRVIAPGETAILAESIPGQNDTTVSNTFWGRLHPYLFSDLPVIPQNDLANNISQRLLTLFGTKDMNTMQGTPFQGSTIYTDTSGISLPLAFNDNVADSGSSVPEASRTLRRIHTFDNPARVVYFSYGSNLFDVNDGQAAVPPPIRTPATQSNIYWFLDNTAAFTFLDGHVEVLKPPLAAERFE